MNQAHFRNVSTWQPTRVAWASSVAYLNPSIKAYRRCLGRTQRLFLRMPFASNLFQISAATMGEHPKYDFHLPILVRIASRPLLPFGWIISVAIWSIPSAVIIVFCFRLVFVLKVFVVSCVVWRFCCESLRVVTESALFCCDRIESARSDREITMKPKRNLRLVMLSTRAGQRFGELTVTYCC